MNQTDMNMTKITKLKGISNYDLWKFWMNYHLLNAIMTKETRDYVACSKTP
jgi:hypothetical protein